MQCMHVSFDPTGVRYVHFIKYQKVWWWGAEPRAPDACVIGMQTACIGLEKATVFEMAMKLCGKKVMPSSSCQLLINFCQECTAPVQNYRSICNILMLHPPVRVPQVTFSLRYSWKVGNDLPPPAMTAGKTFQARSKNNSLPPTVRRCPCWLPYF